MINASQLSTSADLQALLASLGFESEMVSIDQLPVDKDSPRCMLPLGYNPDLENSVAIAIQNGGFALYVYDPYQELKFSPWVNLGGEITDQTLRQTILQAGLTETLEQLHPAANQPNQPAMILTATSEPPPTRRERRLQLIGDALLILGLFALVWFWIEKQVGLFILTWIWLLIAYWMRRKG